MIQLPMFLLGLGGEEKEGWGITEIVIVIIVIVGVIVFMSYILGGTLLDLWNQRVRKFEDIEQLAHVQLYRGLVNSCKLSKTNWTTRLYQKSMDPMVFSNHPEGMVRRGKIKGTHQAESAVYIHYRPRMISRSYVLVFPVEMLRSSLDDVNVVVEGTGLRNLNTDYVVPIPSAHNEGWTEEEIRSWFGKVMEYNLEEYGNFVTVEFGEYLKLKAGSDPTSLRMVQQGIGSMSLASEGEYQGDVYEK